MPKSRDANSPSADDIKEWVKNFIEDQCYDDLRKVVEDYPEKRSLLVNWNKINEFNERLADELLVHPDSVIKTAENVIEDFVIEMRSGRRFDVSDIHFRAEKLPKSQDVKIDIRNLRAKHVGRLLSVVGLVRRANEVRPKILTARFKCLRCGHEIEVPQEGVVIEYPLECHKAEGGCGRPTTRTSFSIMTESCEKVDSQRIEIQELPEELRAEGQPQRMTCDMFDDLTGQIWPGRRAAFNGILRAFPRSATRIAGSGAKSTILDFTIDVLSIDFSDELFSMKLTEKDIKEIQAMAREGRVLERVTSSIAPSLFGLEEEKAALALQMFGGVSKSSDETTRIRGDIHIFLMGDPSTGKSQLLSFVATVAPRAIYASGKAATAAGLTAAAVRDEHDGRWTLEAGALVLADLGLAAVDEMDKMSEQDRSSMHEAMEQQRISVAKAGINATLLTRCSVLGAANPKRGRIEDNIPIIPDQVDIPLPLLQRFDAIFVFKDQPNEKIDSQLAEHIVKSHLVGEMKEADMKVPKELRKRYTPELNKEILSKYIHYAKNNVHPVMTSNATIKIQKYYQALRKKSEGMGQAMLISARHLEGIIRFSEASARARLSNNVDESDVDVAIKIFEKWISRISGEREGWDVDTILTGLPRSLKEEMGAIKQLVEDLDIEDKGVSKRDIIEHARSEKGISKERIELLIEKLMSTGELFETEIDKYRRVQH